MSAEQMRGVSIETPKDPAELLFDSIMADVRNRKKAGEEISFKTHENYQQWLGLRNKNFEETKTAEQQQQYFSGEKADKKESVAAPKEVFRATANDRRIEAETVANEKAQAAYYAKREAEQAAAQAEQAETAKLDFGHYKKGTVDLNKITPAQARIDADQDRARKLSREIKGEKLDLIKVRGIIDSLSEKLTDYQAKSGVFKELGETWFARTTNYLKRERLTNEMAGLNAEITELFAVLKKDFKLAKPESNETAKLIEAFNELDRHVSSGQLKLEVLGYASNFLILAAKLGMLASMAQADLPHQKVEDRSGRPDVAAKFSNENDKLDTSESVRVDEGVAGYKLPQAQPATHSAESSAKVKETFGLTSEEEDKVKNFTEWRRSILYPEYIGKVQKDGTVPSTDKALHVDAGTKLELLDFDGRVLWSEEVKKEKGKSSIWAVLETNKEAIEKIGQEKSFSSLSLRVNGNEYKGAKSKKESTEKTVKKAKVESKTVAPKAKEPKAKKEKVEKKRTTVEAKAGAHDAVKDTVELLQQKGIVTKHIFGQNYDTEQEYEAAILEMQIAQRTIEESTPPSLDKEASEKALRMLESTRVIQVEIDRLKASNEAKAIARHQAVIDKEGKFPEAAAPEKFHVDETIKITDLAKEGEIRVRADKYDAVLIKAHKALESADAFSERATEVEQVKYLAQVKEAEGFYSFLLKEGNVDDKFPSKKFITAQAKIGKELADGQIKVLEESIKQKKEERRKVEAEKAALEAVSVDLPKAATESADLKDLNKLLPKEIINEMKVASEAAEKLYNIDPHNYVGRELYKISSRLKRMTVNKQAIEDFDNLIDQMEKISNELRLKRNAGKLEIPKNYLQVLDLLDKAIQDSGDLIYTRHFEEEK